MESLKSDWERVDPTNLLGEGGQSKVYLVRTPERTKERKQSLNNLYGHIEIGTGTEEQIVQSRLNYVEAIQTYTRADRPDELGAMKEFKFRGDEEQSLMRLKQEIDVLQQNRPGLPKLLGTNIKERWMVTEFFPNGTLEDHLLEYKGNAVLALKAFRSVVYTVSLLHEDNLVHRDIKPANIFVGKEHQLFLGDFGLVYVPDRLPRITRYQETVGAGDFIPPATWRRFGQKLENVKTNFDVYMLERPEADAYETTSLATNRHLLRNPDTLQSL